MRPAALAWMAEVLGAGLYPYVPEGLIVPTAGVLAEVGAARGPPGMMDVTGTPELGAAIGPPGMIDVTRMSELGAAGEPELETSAAEELGAAMGPPGMMDVIGMPELEASAAVPLEIIGVAGLAEPETRGLVFPALLATELAMLIGL